MPRFNVTVQLDLFDPPHPRDTIETWLREGLSEFDPLEISWKDNPYVGDLDRFDPMVRLSVCFVVEHEHREGGYAAGVGRDRVMEVLKLHWGGPIRMFDQQAWGRDVRVRTEFTFKDLCTMLGQLVVASSNLERNVEGMVLNMLPGPDWRRTGLVVDGFNASQMRERCARLAYQVLAGSLQEDVIGWLAWVEEAQSQRNELIHGQWVSRASVADGEIGPAFISRRAHRKRGLTTKTVGHTPETIREVAGRCSALSIEGTELIVELQRFSLAEARGEEVTVPWDREHPPTEGQVERRSRPVS